MTIVRPVIKCPKCGEEPESFKRWRKYDAITGVYDISSSYLEAVCKCGYSWKPDAETQRFFDWI